MKKLYVVLVLCSLVALGAQEETTSAMGEMKMKKRFGIGLAAAGGLSVLGIEADINLTETLSISGGLGTGLDYSTFNLKGKYYLLGESVSPYFGLGVARWWTSGTRERTIGPAVLTNKFLDSRDYTNGFSVWMIYPSVGVQFFHEMGISVYAELQYLFKLFTLANGTYAGLGVTWYF